MNISGILYNNTPTNEFVGVNLLQCFAALQHMDASVNEFTDDCGDYSYGAVVTTVSYFVHLDPVDKVILPALAKKAGIENIIDVLTEFDRIIKLGNKILVTEEWF